ncbi:MAG TPA: hypothetical protein VMW50_12090 [Dehalococcoidia bacterium]|nr:hypothetical protein [Dehalococcoidia bacterium]
MSNALAQTVNNGFHFGGGGINYSSPMEDGQFNGQIKLNKLMMQYSDPKTAYGFSG